jgi:prepilin-type N-terminal cleavage/methylation domain-containing protein
MRRGTRATRGFTLIELMITASLIGVLAAIAIPSFMTYQLRTKRSEAMTNLSGLARTQIAFYSNAGGYFFAAPMPGSVPIPTPRRWTASADAEFAGLGWRPEGHVYFDYDTKTNTDPLGPCGCTGDCFTSSAYGNIDGDGAVSVVMYVHPDKDGVSCPSGVTGDVVPNDTDGNPIFDQPILSASSDDF